MANVFPKSATQPNKVTLTIYNSIPRNYFRLVSRLEMVKTLPPFRSQRKKRTTSTERILGIFAKFPNSLANSAFFGLHDIHTAAVYGMMCGDMDKYMFFFCWVFGIYTHD